MRVTNCNHRRLKNRVTNGSQMTQKKVTTTLEPDESKRESTTVTTGDLNGESVTLEPTIEPDYSKRELPKL